MQSENSPKITRTPDDRDAAVQIPGAVTRWPIDALIAGVRADVMSDVKGWVCDSVLATAVAADLASLIKMLTSSAKSEREWAKKRVRALVKCGETAASSY